jgi:hypothetical protein
MAISVVRPALEMGQETGRLVAWLKLGGEIARKGDLRQGCRIPQRPGWCNARAREMARLP